jgi:hypothetical protein
VHSRGNDNFLFFYPGGKAGGNQIRRCQGIAVDHYGFTLGALALAPSGFCNAGANLGKKKLFFEKTTNSLALI